MSIPILASDLPTPTLILLLESGALPREAIGLALIELWDRGDITINKTRRPHGVSDEDLAIILDPSFSANAAAAKTGRSIAGIYQIRARHKNKEQNA